MKLFTKITALRLLLCGVGLLIFLNVILSYIGESSEETISKLSVRRVHKYSGIYNHTDAIDVTSTLLFSKELSERENTSVISLTSSIPISNLTILQNTTQLQNSPLTIFKSNLSDENFAHTKAVRECKYPSAEEGGPIVPNTTLESLDVIEMKLGPLLKPGGYFEPKNCTPKVHVAIVVPFRDRYSHLSVFINNIHPFLMKQGVSYRIFIVEQTNGQAFNRAALMNIGFLEALKLYSWDCFIFHDVDLLPMDDRNIYNCPRQPRHMSVAIDTFGFKLPYNKIFGGVSAMTTKHFQMVNGFSNSYYGWGGEDDDMANRLEHANLFIARYPINIARYMMLRHQKQKANPKRYENLANSIGKIETDGINSIKYKINSFKEFPTFTWYLADIESCCDRKS